MVAAMSEHANAESTSRDALARGRRWTAWAIALGVLLYVAYALLRGWEETGAALATFRWSLALPVLGLTLVNYGLRYLKWAYLLRRVDVELDHRRNLWIFATGLAMVISPAKAGELVKPYLVRVATGAPMVRTIPALVTERATDGVAVALLAAWGVSTYYAEGANAVLVTLVVSVAGIAALASETLTTLGVRVLAALPVVGRVAEPIGNMLAAMRTCLAPGPLLFTIALSLVAWWAECVGYWLVFAGLGADASLDASTFLYAFATLGGGPSPGGLGLADAFLIEGAPRLVPDLPVAQAVAAALLIRIATLWFGVILGAVALLRIEHVVSETAPEA
ncbi:MAG: flippase-like domain-containing protein [Deltaproteobacteria bacterium]|nr:MAG: flippase-like domain-containing protein [Deltaproteobacteria bacterium]